MKPKTVRKLLLAWLLIEIVTWPVGFTSRPYHAIGGETVTLIAALYANICYHISTYMEG